MGAVEKPEILTFPSATTVSDDLTESDVLAGNNNGTGDSHAHPPASRNIFTSLGRLSLGCARIVKRDATEAAQPSAIMRLKID
jgi:hypothetical protein